MRPYLGEDTTYDSQRFNRLIDCVDDYLNDADVTAQRFYKELLSAIQVGADYHDSYAKKYHEAYLKVCGLLRTTDVPEDKVSTPAPERP